MEGTLNAILGRKPSEAVPVLVPLLGDRDLLPVGYHAGLSLVEIGSPAVPDLTAALRDPSPEARARAAWLLGRIGAEAEEALPALADLSRDADEAVRLEAEVATRRIRDR